MKLIKNVNVYSPSPIGKKDVLICADKIVWIRDEIHLEDPECEVIDGEGLAMVPGFVDQHIHITGGGGEGSFHTRAPEVNLSELIRGGITSVVGLLGTDGVTRSVENLLAKAKALKEEGISCYILTGSYGFPSVTITGDVKKDLAFIDEVIGVKLALSDHRAPNVTKEELTRLASDVRTTAMLSGKAGVVTLHMGDDKRGLQMVFDILDETSIPVSVFRPTHVGRAIHLYEDAMNLAKRGGYFDLTCGPDLELLAKQIRLAKESGVPMDHVTISSDGQGSWSTYDENGKLLKIGVSSVASLHTQFALLVKEGGFAMEEILPLVTSNVADSLKLSGKGHIKEGGDADILLLDKDLSIDTVLAKGQVMMRGKEVKVFGTYER